MKEDLEKRPAKGLVDRLALGLTTFGVGYLPGPTGTYGSAVGVGIFHVIALVVGGIDHTGKGASSGSADPVIFAVLSLGLVLFSLVSFWASSRSVELLGNSDPSEAVVDEVLGQLITFAFIPFGAGWIFLLAGFLLFRLFDIWKPYPIDLLQSLPGGLGICADDIAAGVYAGICLAVIYAGSLAI